MGLEGTSLGGDSPPTNTRQLGPSQCDGWSAMQDIREVLQDAAKGPGTVQEKIEYRRRAIQVRT